MQRRKLPTFRVLEDYGPACDISSSTSMSRPATSLPGWESYYLHNESIYTIDINCPTNTVPPFFYQQPSPSAS